MRMFILSILIFNVGIVTGDRCGINKYESYYASPGDVFIVGLFNAHYDENCSIPNPQVIQQMYNVATAVQLLNNVKYIPGITIGVLLYDICSLKENAQKAFISSLMDEDCNLTYNLGIITTKSVSALIGNFSRILNVPIFILNYDLNGELLIKAAISILDDLNRNSIDVVIVPNINMMDVLYNVTANEGICVKSAVLFSEYNRSCPGNEQIIVLLITADEIGLLLNFDSDCLSTYVIVVMDSNVDFSLLTERLFLHDSYIIIPSNVWPEFTISDEEDFSALIATIHRNIHSSNVTSDLIRTSGKVQSIADYMKFKLVSECGINATGLCDNSRPFNKNDETKIMVQQYAVTSNTLGLPVDNAIELLILQARLNNVEYYRDVRNDVFLSHKDYCQSYPCNECLNHAYLKTIDILEFRVFPFDFKSDSWVASLMTICVIGILITLSVFIFIMVRLCKQDILEGNPYSTILLILGTIFAYLSVLPYCIEYDPDQWILMITKLFGTGFSYSFLFSIILSRSLMILTCDYNGSFMSHINGYLQNFLCFFIALVQIGLIVQFIVFDRLFGFDFRTFKSENVFLVYLVYDAFLLLFTALVVPFIAKSRRNYREGLCFAVATASFVLIWAVWSFGYFTTSWKDFCIAAGLAGTATAVVVCVLVPRTYLIITGLVRDRITSAIPSNVSNLDMNYRSTQALYDTLKLKDGEQNMGFYDDPRNSTCTVLSSRHSPDIVVHEEYDSCDAPNQEQRLTRF